MFANLAFLAWAEWVDAPQPAPANEAYAKLPRLKLVNELPESDARPSSGNGTARKTALEVAPQAPPATSRCLSVGPFDDQPSATRGASQLREKGLAPRQRVEKGEISKGFWVYIGGLKTDSDVSEVLRTLEQSHVEDAHLMSDTGDVHQVSVGLFSAVPFAEKAYGNLVDIAGIRHEVGVLDVALLQGPQDLGDVTVGFQAADIDPEALGDLPLLDPLPRCEPLFTQL